MEMLFVMNPLERAAPDKDTTWALMRQARARGHATFFASAEDYGTFKLVRRQVLRPPFPASTGVVAGMLIPGMLVEMDAVAVRGEARTLRAG